MGEAQDRAEIGELLARYAYAVDTGRWDLLREVFTPDATIDYTSSGGPRGGREEVVAWLAKVLPAWPGRQHLIGQTMVEVTGDEARVVAAFRDTLAPSRETRGPGGVIHGGGWYHHRLLRTPEGWRSRDLVEEQTWRVMT
ncbi:nuclear transport factor 2 family protein [Bailinhaonella thermotolerans]|uniref:Nuclear transport factor 2 family protein n=1 Tax=Bailinhaonella thermotolerans TaxID=1070861 RepID=A0A3A4B0L6_9ACTN|nr:nuclear transport factor 2 family protein [Bailinhaonella thermotolerans]RJL35265.1 nuclear transport factor 2 family protein [Bailinhaonella thermotolerans]